MVSSASFNPPAFPVTGAILAGGRSSRMGRDKAFLPFPAPDGPALLTRQAALLRDLGIDDLLLSGRPETDYRTTFPDARVVVDAVSNAGPLAGLSAILAAARHPWVLVIAVDLPRLTPEMLQTLLLTGAGQIGVVPQSPHGFEPLVALYPQALLPSLSAALERKQLGLQCLLRAAVDDGLMRAWPIPPEHSSLFANWNTPDDILRTE